MALGRSNKLVFLVALVLWSSAFDGLAHGQTDTVQTVVEVDIIGNRSFSRGDLMDVIETRESSWFSWMPWVDPAPMIASLVRTDVLRLSDFYRNEGFLGVSIDTLIERQTKGIRVAFLVTEGDPVLVDSIRVNGIEDFRYFDPGALKTVRGNRLTRAGIEDDRLLILTTLRDSGFVFADVVVRSAIRQDRRRATVDLNVDPGKRYRFGDVIVKGNRKVGSSTIKRGVTFRPGATFEQRQVRETRRQLYRSGAFRSVVLAFPDSLAVDTTVSTVVTVSERSLRSVKLGAGYDTQNEINGSLSWTHRSVFGGAQQLRVQIQSSAILTEFRASLTQPYVFGSRNWMNFRVSVLNGEKESFSQTEVKGNVAFERNIAPRTTLLFEIGSGFIDFKADSFFVEFVTEFVNDRRDDFLDPQKGLYIRLEAREKGALLSSARELFQLTAEGRWYSGLPFRSVLATKVYGGLIVNLSEEGEVPNFERFFGGGLSSVRGWPFNQLGPKDDMGEAVGGKSKFESSIELRTRFGKYLGTAIFLDVGQVDPQFSAFDFGQLKWAVGGGIRYLSPVGPIRLDAGRRLSDDNTDLWQYHFSIGQAF
jgi:outer membrane protein assembly complex protein YaeT